METQEEGVVAIYAEGDIIGIIHRDAKTGHKIMYSCQQMDIDEMRKVIENKAETPIKKQGE